MTNLKLKIAENRPWNLKNGVYFKFKAQKLHKFIQNESFFFSD